MILTGLNGIPDTDSSAGSRPNYKRRRERGHSEYLYIVEGIYTFQTILSKYITEENSSR